MVVKFTAAATAVALLGASSVDARAFKSAAGRTDMIASDEVAALLQPIPSFVGSCAGSPFGVSDDVPIGRSNFDDIVAIGKVIGPDGLLHGWVYKTTNKHLLIQRVRPALPRDGRTNSARVYTDLEAFRPTQGDTIVACTSADFRYPRSLKL